MKFHLHKTMFKIKNWTVRHSNQPVRRSKIALLHIPKTGGTALARHIFEQTCADQFYFFSFTGQDASGGANRTVVEFLSKADHRYQQILHNRHFLESGVISGHFSYDLRNILSDFSFEFATVVREPIERCISHICQLTRDTPNRGRFGAFDVPSQTTDPRGFWREIRSILERFPRQQIPGLNPHSSMLLNNGMCHMIGGTPLHTYTPEVDYDRALQHLSVFRLAVFEQFNESCSAMLRSLEIPVVVDDRTNPSGAGYPPIYKNHSVNYGAPDDILELVRSMNQEDIRLYRAAITRLAENMQRSACTNKS